MKDEVEFMCKNRLVQLIRQNELLQIVEEIDFYSIIQIERNKKEVKLSKIILKVELEDLVKELQIIIDKQAGIPQKKEDDDESTTKDEEQWRIV